ncbi:MAG: hypothetical protein J6H21_00610 [Firmicutes bacterium]|nr:hypothetical protein [Bacillota bacterium]
MPALQEYKCPCCGGSIEWNSTVQQLKCPFCDTEFDLETLKGYDEDIKQDGQDDMTWNPEPGDTWSDDEASQVQLFVCKSCGGEIIGDKNMGATSCPYCNNAVVVPSQFSGDLRPDFVIPFKKNKEEAKAALKNHLRRKRFLPKVFTDENHIDEIKGIYVPFWLFDAKAEAHARYKASNVRVWSDRDYQYTETTFYSVSRAGYLDFDHVAIDGSSKMADDLMESIEPFDFSEAVDFRTAYLAGFLADRYDVTAEQSIERANSRIRKTTEEEFEKTVQGYSSVVPESESVRLKEARASYALYPVWLLNTSWQGEQYTFAMNGQTGKFVGDLPVDQGAYTRSFVITALGVAAAVMGALTLINIM